MKHIIPLIQGVLLERFLLIVRQRFGGMRHHRFWLQRQNMDLCLAHSSSWRCSPLISGHFFYGPSFLFVFDVCCGVHGIWILLVSEHFFGIQRECLLLFDSQLHLSDLSHDFLCEEFQDLERPIGAYTKFRFS